MSRICQISGKKSNNAYSVSHSHVRTKKKQLVNLQRKRVWSATKKYWVTMKISTKTIKSLSKLKLL